MLKRCIFANIMTFAFHHLTFRSMKEEPEKLSDTLHLIMVRLKDHNFSFSGSHSKRAKHSRDH